VSQEERELLYYEPIEKVDRFDVLIRDLHCDHDRLETIEGSAGLTIHQVWEWLSEGGDWAFQVTAAGNPDRVFMSGYTYDYGMRHASEGRVLQRVSYGADSHVAE
jgi:hypothetical protein